MSELHRCSGGCGRWLAKPDSLCFWCWADFDVKTRPETFELDHENDEAFDEQ